MTHNDGFWGVARLRHYNGSTPGTSGCRTRVEDLEASSAEVAEPWHAPRDPCVTSEPPRDSKGSGVLGREVNMSRFTRRAAVTSISSIALGLTSPQKADLVEYLKSL